MKSRKFLAVLYLVLIVPAAYGATWEVTVEAPEQGEVLTVALPEEVVSLDGVRVRVTGINKVGGYDCDGVAFPEPLYLEGTFGEPGDSDDMSLMDEIWHDDIVGSEFDVIHEFDLSDPAAWAFLEDGAGEFAVSWFRAYQDPMGWCTHLFSVFDLESITLSIDYNLAVPVDRRTWGSLKANYRN